MTRSERNCSNLVKRKIKGPPALGRLCSPLSSMGPKLAARERLTRLAQALKWVDHPADFVFASSERSRDGEELLADDANSLYLHLRSRKAFRQRNDA